MSSDRVLRHKARQATLSTLQESRNATEKYRVPITITCATTQNDDAADILAQFSQRQQDELQEFLAPITVSTAEVNQLIDEIRSRWDDQQISMLLGNCRQSVLSSIAGPFGLGGGIGKLDKDGGNVDTVHNARSGVYATEAAQQEYLNRSEYDSAPYHQHENYIGTNRKNAEKLANGILVDEYTGRVFKPEERHDEQSKPNLDHAVAAKIVHDDAGRVLAGVNGAELANMDANLHATNASVNKAKRDKTAAEFKQYLEQKAPERRARIEELQSKKAPLTDQERKQLAKLTKQESCDLDRLEKIEADARSAIDNKINKAYYGSAKFAVNSALTSVTEGVKMGTQQAMGLLLTEFFSACFDEISDAYQNGFHESLSNQGFFDALKTRLGRISERVAVKWKNALSSFKEGAISGFLSNLVTTLINMLVTTGKRLVRVIREGLMSIIRALKMALFPPKGMSTAEAGDAAIKLLATGATVTLGILAEEAVEKSVAAFFETYLPPLMPLAATVSAVFVGAMTGIASALLVYGLDQLDIFGVYSKKQHTFVLKELDALIESSDKNINGIYDSEMARFNAMLAKLQGVG